MPTEIAVGKEGNWRFTQMGLLDIITKDGRPTVLIADSHQAPIPVDVIVSNIVRAARDRLPQTVGESQSQRAQIKIDLFRAILAGIQAERNGETINIWQEHLLRLLKELTYTKEEIKAGIWKCFPPDGPDVTADFKAVFNRAATYVWGAGPGKMVIY